MRSRFATLLILIWLAQGVGSSLFAQRRVVLGATVDLTAAVDDNPKIGETGGFRLLEAGWTTNYSPRATLEARLTGRRSTGTIFYGLGLNRFVGRSELNHESHHAGIEFQTQLGRRLNLSIFENYLQSPDFTTSTVLGGIRVTPEGLFFDFENVLVRRSGFSNSTGANLKYELSPVSELQFQLSHRVRRFDEHSAFDELSDQNSFSGDLSYRRRLQERTSWDIRFRFAQNDFRNFENARNQEITIGLNHQLTPNVRLRLGAGPSFTRSMGGMTRVAGSNVETNLSYTRDQNRISLTFRRLAGAPIGVGSVSNVHQAGLGFDRTLPRDAIWRTSISAFDSVPLFDNPVRLRRYGGETSLTIPLGLSGWFLVVGGSLFDQQGTSRFALDRTRVYASLRFSLPEFFSF